MAVTVKVAEAKAHLSGFLAKIKADEEIIIARPSCVRRENDIDVLIAEIQAQRAGRQPTTQDEIRAWRDEGQR